MNPVFADVAVLMQAGGALAARTVVDETRARVESPEELLLFSEVLEATGSFRRARALRRLGTWRFKESDAVRVAWARDLVESGRATEALRLIDALPDGAEGGKVAALRARVTGAPFDVVPREDVDVDAVVDAALAGPVDGLRLTRLCGILARFPQAARLRLLVVDQLHAANRHAEARDVLRAGARGARDDARLELAHAVDLFGAGRFDEASLAVARLRARHPPLARRRDLRLLLALSTWHAGQRENAAAVLAGAMGSAEEYAFLDMLDEGLLAVPETTSDAVEQADSHVVDTAADTTSSSDADAAAPTEAFPYVDIGADLRAELSQPSATRAGESVRDDDEQRTEPALARNDDVLAGLDDAASSPRMDSPFDDSEFELVALAPLSSGAAEPEPPRARPWSSSSIPRAAMSREAASEAATEVVEGVPPHDGAADPSSSPTVVAEAASSTEEGPADGSAGAAIDGEPGAIAAAASDDALTDALTAFVAAPRPVQVADAVDDPRTSSSNLSSNFSSPEEASTSSSLPEEALSPAVPPPPRGARGARTDVAANEDSLLDLRPGRRRLRIAAAVLAALLAALALGTWLRRPSAGVVAVDGPDAGPGVGVAVDDGARSAPAPPEMDRDALLALAKECGLEAPPPVEVGHRLADVRDRLATERWRGQPIVPGLKAQDLDPTLAGEGLRLIDLHVGGRAGVGVVVRSIAGDDVVVGWAYFARNVFERPLVRTVVHEPSTLMEPSASPLQLQPCDDPRSDLDGMRCATKRTMCRGANVGVRARCRKDGATLGSCELDTVVVALGS